ncbi:zinc finger, CCHC-type containing protein [Tanacetum coccineum]
MENCFVHRPTVKGRATLSGLTRAETVKASLMLLEFWPTIRDGSFNTGNTKVKSIRDPKIRLAYRCIATTISRRKESTNRVTKIDLYYLYCIYTNECRTPTLCIQEKVTYRNGVIMELHNGGFCWPATREAEVEEENEGDDGGNEAARGYAGHEGVGGSADIYHHMSQSDWQVCQACLMDRQDEQYGRLNTWMGQQDE